METYIASVTVQIEVDAYSRSDAVDIIHDTFDPGDLAGLRITRVTEVSID
jgi:hypothetical protein